MTKITTFYKQKSHNLGLNHSTVKMFTRAEMKNGFQSTVKI